MSRGMELIKPHLRAAKYAWLYRRGRRLVGRSHDAPLNVRIAFFFGCGRSGTTILGKIFSSHPRVKYLFEPYHTWAAIDPRTDMLQLYVAGDAHCLLDEREVDASVRSRFNRAIAAEADSTNIDLLIEKTPINAMRLGYLNALAHEARFAHIVRDGADVARSIARLAKGNTYRIAGKPALNQWWGVDDSKWKILAHDGAASGYYPVEARSLRTHEERGAYEWLVSLGEVDRRRECLADRLFEFTYDRLTESPRETVCELCSFLGLDAPESWLESTLAVVDKPRRNAGERLQLPAKMSEDFNRFQERYGFTNRAAASEAVA